MSEAWAIIATSSPRKAPASTRRRFPTPISSAGEPTTTSRASSGARQDASAKAAHRLAGPERLWPQAWPISGSASISASNAARSGACGDPQPAISAVSRPAAPRSTAKPRAARRSA
jgi:hypothetical protein